MKKPKTMILMLLSLVLLLNTGMGRVRTPFVSDTSFDENGNIVLTIPARVNVSGADANTPSPGTAVFHFKIWMEDSSVPLTIVSDTVWTNGFGDFSANLVFTIPEEYMRALYVTPLYVQQYDGNPDWVFDTTVMEFFYQDPRYLRVENPASMTSQTVDYAAVHNIYKKAPAPPEVQPSTEPAVEPAAEPSAPENPVPAEPLPAEPVPVNTDNVTALPVQITKEDAFTRITLPVFIGVEKYGTDAPPAAVFTFGLYGIQKEQEYAWEKDTVTVPGAGLHSGSISFTVPDGEALSMLMETGFDVRERTAVVPGWSFSGEVYHIRLFESENGPAAEVERIREGRTVDTPADALLFLNYYGMDSGIPVELPGSATGVKDMLQEIRELEHVTIKDTFHVSDSEGRWEIRFEAVKTGYEIGNAALTMRYAKGDSEYRSVSLEDVLRIQDQCFYIRLQRIADAYTELSGKEFLCQEAVPEGEWTAFTNEMISWLDLPSLDILMRSLIRNAGPAFDAFTTVRSGNGYTMSGSRPQFDRFQLKAMETAGRKHSEWYALAEKAALSDEMKRFAASYENAFSKLLLQSPSDAEKLAALREQFPKILKRFTFSVELLKKDTYQVLASGQYVNDEGVVRDFDSILTTESALSDGVRFASPGNAVSGAPYLYALIMRYALKEQKNAERPYASDQTAPDAALMPDGSAEGSMDAEPYVIDSDDENDINEYLACMLKLNQSCIPKNGKYFTEGESVVIWVRVKNNSETEITNIYFYDDSDDSVICYDTHYYPKNLKTGPWFIEKISPWGYWTFMYYHEITAEECEKGAYTFKMYAKSAEGLLSNQPELTVAAGGSVRTPEPEPEEQPVKTAPTVILTESSQPSHPDTRKYHYEDYYVPGELIRYKLTVRNETDASFYDLCAGAEPDRDTLICTIPELLPGEEDIFFFEREVLPVSGFTYQSCTAWVSYYNTDQEYRFTHPDTVLVTVAPE